MTSQNDGENIFKNGNNLLPEVKRKKLRYGAAERAAVFTLEPRGHVDDVVYHSL